LGGRAAGAVVFVAAPVITRATGNRAEQGEEMTATLATPLVQSIELSSGVTLQFVEQGAPAGTPVVLLHGVTDSWRSFEPVLPHLPAAIHAFALTQRGHGDAERPATGYGWQEFAADVAAFMDALGIESAIVAGTSMGASVAQRFALDYPERTQGLVLMGTFHSYRANPIVVEFAQVVATLTDPIDPAFAREFQESTLARPVPTALLETVVQESLKVPARVWRAAFAGFLADDFPGEIGGIAAPTLIIWGDQDAFAPHGDQEALLEAIAGSRLAVYAGAGHALHWEEPARFAADLAAFVARLER
jgi:pimeloyl-ACP methyl ester carboxylesterase